MLPTELTAASFAGYPSQARQFAVAQLTLLQKLPLAFATILLREIAAYDWRLPAERNSLQRQISFLGGLAEVQREVLFAKVRSITVPPEWERMDWVSDPAGFIEKLTASLWSTGQMELLRSFAGSYQQQVDAAFPPPVPAKTRLGMVVLGSDLKVSAGPLFPKLSRYGVTFSALKPADGWLMILEYAAARASPAVKPFDDSFRHWYVDGGSADAAGPLVTVSYHDLEEPRMKLLSAIQRDSASGTMGPEGLRSKLAQMRPRNLGLDERGAEGVLNRFRMSVLTEGSGTQIFSTTFAQWAARECIRRAEPETLLLRFAARKRAASMDQMLTPDFAGPADPQGSMIDAQMGAYYTWLELRRLPGAEMRFLVWLQGSSKALMIGPGLPQGTSSSSPLTLRQLLEL